MADLLTIPSEALAVSSALFLGAGPWVVLAVSIAAAIAYVPDATSALQVFSEPAVVASVSTTLSLLISFLATRNINLYSRIVVAAGRLQGACYGMCSVSSALLGCENDAKVEFMIECAAAVLVKHTLNRGQLSKAEKKLLDKEIPLHKALKMVRQYKKDGLITPPEVGVLVGTINSVGGAIRELKSARALALAAVNSNVHFRAGSAEPSLHRRVRERKPVRPSVSDLWHDRLDNFRHLWVE